MLLFYHLKFYFCDYQNLMLEASRRNFSLFTNELNNAIFISKHFTIFNETKNILKRLNLFVNFSISSKPSPLTYFVPIVSLLF